MFSSITSFKSFYQNYLFVCLFAVCFLVLCFSLFGSFLIRIVRSSLNTFYFRYVCFGCVCIIVNHFDVRNDGNVVPSLITRPFFLNSEKPAYNTRLSHFSLALGSDVNHFSVENLSQKFDTKTDVNHFSVENLSQKFATKTDVNNFSVENLSQKLDTKTDVNHFSVDNLFLLKNITFHGDLEQSNCYMKSYNQTFRSLYSVIKFTFSRNFPNSPKFSRTSVALVFCVITNLLRFLSRGVRVANYRLIDTPKRVLLRRTRHRSHNLKLITLFTLVIYLVIRSNDPSPIDHTHYADTRSLERLDTFSSLFVDSKGKPIRVNFLLLLILSGDIETNPGPPTKPQCESCFRTIAINHRFVSCVECESRLHIKCAGVSPNQYNRMQADRTLTFYCPPCLSSTLPFADVEPDEYFDDVFVLPDHIEPLNLFKKSSLNIAHLNVNGLRSKLDFVKILLFQEKFDILCLNETKIDSTVSDSDIAVPGYLLHRLDRTAHGGGTLIYYAKSLDVKRNTRLTKKAHESLWVEVRFKKSKPIYICSLYRPPCSKAIEDTTKYTQYLSSCFDNLQKDSEVFILGDFNVDISKKNNLSSLITEFCKSKDLTQYVSSPTRITEYSSTAIDLAISNSGHAKDCYVIELGISDHCLVFIRREKTHVDRKPRTITTRSFKNFNQEPFLDDLGNLDWSPMLKSTNVDEAAEIFNSNVLGVLDKHAPVVQRRIRIDSPPWFNEELYHAIQERDYLLKLASRCEKGSPEWTRYKRKKNSVIKLKDRLKREYYQKSITDSKSESRKLWKTLQNLVPGKKSDTVTPHSLNFDDKEISDKKEMASIFNNFFATVGSKLGENFNFSDTDHISLPMNENHFNFSHVNLSTVQKIISKLDNSKATGLDGINVRALKFGSPILSFYLAHLFNLSLSTGTVPSCWKKKRVTPVFKKGDSGDVNNYRPISILPITMKIFEKVVHSQVSDFLDASDILSQSQSGFRNRYSTDTAVICVSDFILQELGKGKYVGAVLVDLKKAFDTVDHKILLKKLFCYGFRDASFAWFESYLSDRLQCTQLEEISSDLKEEGAYGVPQGSVLGPLLFLLYINDIGKSVRTNVFHHLYADDTIIAISTDCPLRLRKELSDQLSDIGKWFSQNKLTVNTTKTEVIFFGRANKVKECKNLVPIKFQGDTLACKEKVKYLGVIFDENLNWDSQAKNARKKAYLSLNKIKRISSCLDLDTKKMLVNALVMPHVTYCSSSWSSMSKANHKKFDSLIGNISRLVPINKTFEQIVQHNKTMLMFKGMRNIAPTYLCNRVKPVDQRHQRVTRFALQGNVVVPISKNSFASRTFINSSTSVWNNLPVEIKSIESLLLFKSAIKRHIFG